MKGFYKMHYTAADQQGAFRLLHFRSVLDQCQ